MNSVSKPIAFREVQQFRQLWLWIVLAASTLPVAGIFGYGMVEQLVLGNQWGNKPMSDTGLLVSGIAAIVISLGLLIMFWRSYLVTEVRHDGLFVRFFPFHWSFKRIELERVQDVEAKTYSPLMQYGGWGIRYGRGGKAYNVSGKKGVMLTYNNAKTLLIGSQESEKLEAAIKSVWKAGAVS